MPIKWAILILPLLLVAALPACARTKIVLSTKQQTEQAIIAVLHKQAAAWNRGDLENFMTAYLRTSAVSYISGAKEIRGYDALYERYRTKYGDSPGSMGKLSFSDFQVTSLGNDSALCIGKWLLNRENQPEVSGMFSLVFLHTKQGWKILHDHTSTNQF